MAVRRDVSADELESFLKVMESGLGARPATDAEALRKTANYLESTLGPRNLGFDVQRVSTVSPEGVEFTHIVAELPGSGHDRGIVLVAGRLDTETGEGGGDASIELAVLLSLAQSLTGESHNRTIRFVAYVEGGGDALAALPGAVRPRGGHFAGVVSLTDVVARWKPVGAPLEPSPLARVFKEGDVRVIGLDSPDAWKTVRPDAEGGGAVDGGAMEKNTLRLREAILALANSR